VRAAASDGDATVTGGAIQLLNIVLRNIWTIIGGAFLCAVVAGAIALQTKRTYTSTALFTSQSGGPDSRVQSIAATLGLSMGGAAQTESPQFYADLVKSDEILNRVATTRFPNGGTTAALPELLRIKEPDSAKRVYETVKELREIVDVHTNLRTGVIDVAVRTQSASLSAQVADSLLSILNAFNLASRRTRATNEREFSENLLIDYRGKLKHAEDEYEDFLRSNVIVRGPQLTLQDDRHRREIAMLQTIVNTLATSHEQARLDEVRNTPAINVIGRPRPAVVPNPRGAFKKALLAALAGAIAALLYVIIVERIRHARAAGDEDLEELLARGRRLVPGRRGASA
jgi:uncharacterized protein involved in exopolysaccharide biosynthesis